MEFAAEHGLGAVGGLFTYDGEAGLNVHGADFVRGTGLHQANLCTVGKNGVLECLESGDLGISAHVGSGPDVNLSAAGAEEVEGEYVLGGRSEAGHGCSCSTDFVCAERARSGLGGSDGGVLDAVNLLEVGDFLGPGKGYARALTGAHLEVEIVLDRIGLYGFLRYGDAGRFFLLVESLYRKPVGLVCSELLYQRHAGGIYRFGEIFLGAGFVGIDGELVVICVFCNVPGEGHHVAQGAVYLGFKVHGLQAALEVHLLDDFYLALHAGDEGSEREQCADCVFDKIVEFHKS